MRFIDRNIFQSYKIKKDRYDSKYLEWEQLKIIERKRLHQPMISLVRDLFVFCCYTGMAPIDMQLLQPLKFTRQKMEWFGWNIAELKVM